MVFFLEKGISPPRSEALLCLPGWETGPKTKRKGRKRERGEMGRASIPAPGGGHAGGCAPWVLGIGGGLCGEWEAVGGAEQRGCRRVRGSATQWGERERREIIYALTSDWGCGRPSPAGVGGRPLPIAPSTRLLPPCNHTQPHNPLTIRKTPIQHRSGIAGLLFLLFSAGKALLPLRTAVCSARRFVKLLFIISTKELQSR